MIGMKLNAQVSDQPTAARATAFLETNGSVCNRNANRLTSMSNHNFNNWLFLKTNLPSIASIQWSFQVSHTSVSFLHHMLSLSALSARKNHDSVFAQQFIHFERIMTRSILNFSRLFVITFGHTQRTLFLLDVCVRVCVHWNRDFFSSFLFKEVSQASLLWLVCFPCGYHLWIMNCCVCRQKWTRPTGGWPSGHLRFERNNTFIILDVIRAFLWESILVTVGPVLWS